MYDAFLSYSREDASWATVLADALRRRRGRDSDTATLQVFLDTDSIPPGANWLAALEEGLRQSRHIVPLFSSAFFESEAAGWELLQKLLTDLSASQRVIIPCLIRKCEIPERLRHIQYIDMRGLDEANPEFWSRVDTLAQALGSPAETAQPPFLEAVLPQFPYYVYVSDSKIAMWSRGHEGRADRRFAAVAAIVKDLYDKHQVSDHPDQTAPFFACELLFKWGVIDWGVCDADVRTAFFVCTETDPIVLLGGSGEHAIGVTPFFQYPPRSFGYSGSHLPGLIRAMASATRMGDDWRPPMTSGEEYLVAARFIQDIGDTRTNDQQLQRLTFAEQRLWFVARVLKHLSLPSETELGALLAKEETRSGQRSLNVPDKDILVASPLCVAIAS